MFLESVWLGIQSLFDWRILIGMACVSGGTAVFMMLIGALMGGGGEPSGARTGVGCLVTMLGGPLVQAALIGLFVLILLPSLFLGSGFTPSAVVSALWWDVVKQSMWSMGGVMLLCCVPLVGGIISETPGVVTFLVGTFVARPLAKDFFHAFRPEAKFPKDAIPGFMTTAGFAIFGLIVIYAVFIIVGIVRDQVKRRTDPTAYMLESYGVGAESSSMQLFGFLSGPVIGIIPLLMYCKYLALNIQHHING
jgi:hypothetical protein